MLKKEIMELCLLAILAEKDEYGYELMRRLKDAFPDTQESAIYAQLRGLCRDEYSEQYYGETSEGPARKYYRLTPSGKRKYQDLLQRWRVLKDALSDLGIE